MSASAARQTLPAQLDKVEAGEEVSITRHGRIVAVLVRPDVLTARRASAALAAADRIGDLLDRARNEPLPLAAIGPERVEELVEGVRIERSKW